MHDARTLTGTTIAGGQFQLSARIGAGGFAEVYLATQLNLNRTVAVKILWDEGIDAETLRRFEGEAQAIAALEQRNIVRIIVFGREEGFHFAVMNLLFGTLKDLIETSPAAPLPETLLVARGVLAALHAAHGQAIAHRDIKPENIMFDAAGTPVVTDFGLVRRLDRTLGLTQDGSFMGTPLYMSPEQVDPGQREDTRSDLYSFGVLLYELLTGKTPYHDLSFFEVCEAHRTVTPPRPSSIHPASPPDLDAIVMRCLEKDRARRYQTAAEVLEDLDALPREVGAAFSESTERIRDLRMSIETRWKELRNATPTISSRAGADAEAGADRPSAPVGERETVLATDHDIASPPRPAGGGRGRRVPAWAYAGAALLFLGGAAGVALIQRGEDGGAGPGSSGRASSVEGAPYLEGAGRGEDGPGAGSGGTGTQGGGGSDRGETTTGGGDGDRVPVDAGRTAAREGRPQGSAGKEAGTSSPATTDARLPRQEVRIAVYDGVTDRLLPLARVTADGELHDEGAIQTLALAPGKHRILVTCVGYVEQSFPLDVVRGTNPARKVYLERE